MSLFSSCSLFVGNLVLYERFVKQIHVEMFHKLYPPAMTSAKYVYVTNTISIWLDNQLSSECIYSTTVLFRSGDVSFFTDLPCASAGVDASFVLFFLGSITQTKRRETSMQCEKLVQSSPKTTRVPSNLQRVHFNWLGT